MLVAGCYKWKINQELLRVDVGKSYQQSTFGTSVSTGVNSILKYRNIYPDTHTHTQNHICLTPFHNNMPLTPLENHVFKGAFIQLNEPLGIQATISMCCSVPLLYCVSSTVHSISLIVQPQWCPSSLPLTGV